MIVDSVAQPPAAVFVDAGGVLLLPNLTGLAKHFGLENRTFDELYQAFFAAFEHYDPQRPEEEWLWAAFLQEFGVEPKVIVALIEPLITRELDPWGATEGGDPIAAPGAIGFLRVLEQADITAVVVSNANGRVKEMLEIVGVCQVGTGSLPSVAGIVDSHLVGVSKPNPRIFHFARELAGANGTDVNLADCVHVGDALWSDVRGAVAAGIPAIHLDPQDACAEPFGHVHERDLAGVLNELGLRLRR